MLGVRVGGEGAGGGGGPTVAEQEGGFLADGPAEAAYGEPCGDGVGVGGAGECGADRPGAAGEGERGDGEGPAAAGQRGCAGSNARSAARSQVAARES